MKTLILLLILFCWSNFIDAQNVYIPDANFKNYLLNNTAINTNGDTAIQVSEAAAFTGTINVYNKSIFDLTGIEYFTALTNLNCRKNQLTGLNVSANTALITLDCGENQLTNLDVTTNIALTQLNCSFNQLTNLDLSNNAALSCLSCLGNQLTNLDISTNTALDCLICSGNFLTNLDVSSNTLLSYLECQGNQLTNLDISTNTALAFLSCGVNPLSNLDVSINTALAFLDCQDNQLTNLDISTNTALDYLICYGNQLTNLDISANPNLTTLQCQNNPNLQCLPLLPAGLTTLYTDVSCLPNIPAGLTTSIPLCNSSSSCFLYPSITGHAYIDMNNNGTQDTTDFDAAQQVVSGGIFTTATNNLGNYNLILDTTTTQNISIQNPNPNYFTLSPSSIPITTTNTSAQTFPNNDFRLIPIGTQSDAEAHIIGGLYRPGFTTTIAFVCENVGNTVLNSIISLNIDPNLTVISSSIAPNGGVGNNMTYNLTSLALFDETTIYVEVFTPISLALGSPITNAISIAVTNEVTPTNNTFTENAVVVGSYDPNDKTADIDYITPTEIAAGKEINYTIRFQNTGTFPADFVIVTDTLDNDLDVSTLELISTSHSLSKMTIGTDILNPNQPNVVKWYFYNINLPDSASNEAGSHGYIRFRIRPKQGLPLGTLIENMAGIVFDFNAPVLTNTWVIPMSLGAGAEILDAMSQDYTIYPNPVEDKLFIQSKNNEGYFVSLLSINGQIIYTSEEKTEMTTLDMKGLQAGLYLVQIVDKQGAYVQKIVVE